MLEGKHYLYTFLHAETHLIVPVDDADHAVLTVVGAVDAQLVQQVQQQHAEVTVKLTDGGFEAYVWLEGVCVLS